MPSITMYELKVSGVLKGRIVENTTGISAFQGVFPDKPPGPGAPLGPWPAGLIWPDYEIREWKPWVEEEPTTRVGPEQDPGPDRKTRLTFRCQAARVVPGTLFDNRNAMLPHVNWFYEYCKKPWQQDLCRMLNGLNDALRASGSLLIPVDFRDWKWYCGNGGGT